MHRNGFIYYCCILLVSCGLTTEPKQEEPFIIKIDQKYGGKPTKNLSSYDVTQEKRVIYD
jgi:hypothetical protein